MGNQVLQCGHCTKEVNEWAPACGRYAQACGVNDEDLSRYMCDPAGVIFAENVAHLSELAREVFHFAGTGNLAALRWLFVLGVKHEVVDSNDTTLLHVACRTGSIQVVKDLVRRGLNINAVDQAGWTPLHVASCMGRQDVSLYLLHAGAKPNCKNSRGQLPEDLCSHPFTKEMVVGYEAQARARPSQWTFPKRAMEAHSMDFDERMGAEVTNEWGSSLHFEPFFVPRDAVLHEPKIVEELQHLGIDVFNRSPGHGIAFLVAAGVVPDYPVNINNFLVKENGHPGAMGEFLGEDCPIAQTLRLEFLNSLQLLGTGIISALQVACHDVRMPTSLVKVDRLLRGVAHFWWQQHDEELTEKRTGNGHLHDRQSELRGRGARGELTGLQLQQSVLGTDSLHRLMFSTLMLFRWLEAGHAMSLNEWSQLNTGIEAGGTDMPMHVQSSIYTAITEFSARLTERLICLPSSPPKAGMRGWAHLRYSGRAQVSHDGDPAAWTAATPRALAVQGGVTSAGQASPLPGLEEEHIEAISAMSSLVNSMRREEHQQQQQQQQQLQLQQQQQQHPNVGDEEHAWMSLHGTILFLFLSQEMDAPPYAFASLRRAEMSQVDATSRRLVLRGSRDAARPPTANDDEWLELCLLLGDGRFQPMEAPRLELRFEQQSEFEQWTAHLRHACQDRSVGPPPPQNIFEALDQSLPALLSSKWADEPAAPAQPFTEEERFFHQRMVAV